MKINLRHKITQRLRVFFKVLQLLVNHGTKYALDLTFLTINNDKKQGLQFTVTHEYSYIPQVKL